MTTSGAAWPPILRKPGFQAREDDEILLIAQPFQDIHDNLIRASFGDMHIRKGRCDSPTLARLLFAGQDALQHLVKYRSAYGPSSVQDLPLTSRPGESGIGQECPSHGMGTGT